MTNEELIKEIGRIADGLKNIAIANQEAIRSIAASLNEYIQGFERLATRCEKCGGLGAKWRGDMNLCEACFDAMWEKHYAPEYRAEDLALEEAREEVLKEGGI